MTGIRWNPPEWDRNPQEWTGIHRNGTGIRRNEYIPAGIEHIKFKKLTYGASFVCLLVFIKYILSYQYIYSYFLLLVSNYNIYYNYLQ
jgi:hypothetical protein